MFNVDEFGYAMNPPNAFQPRGGPGSMCLHGSKGSSAPPPDPRLTQAQITSMGIQDQVITQALKNSNELAPLQKEELRNSIDRGTTLYGQSQDDRTYGLQRRGVLTGLQDQMVTDAQTYNSPARQEQMAAEAQADVTAAYDNAQSQQTRGLERSGVNPNSGKYMAMQNQNSIARASSSASAANKTRQAARLEGFQLNDRASNAFSGYPSSTASSVGAGLSTAGFGLASANTGRAGLNSGLSTVGGMAGDMGRNATGMWNAQAGYKTGQDKIRADNDPFKVILGAVAGAGANYLGGKASDRRSKTDIVAVGELPNGLIVYTYRYKTGGPVEMGVMADEVAILAPQAFIKGAPGEFNRVDYAKL